MEANKSENHGYLIQKLGKMRDETNHNRICHDFHTFVRRLQKVIALYLDIFIKVIRKQFLHNRQCPV
jgi:hypothetical protein